MKRITILLALASIFACACSRKQIEPQPEARTLDTFEAVQKSILLLKGETSKIELKSSIELSELEIDWTSSNPKIASVSDAGLVTALKEGETEVSAYVNKFGNEAIVKVTVAGVKIDISPASDTIALGAKLIFLAKVEPDGKDIPLKWSSSDANVVTVSSTGEATGAGTGIAYISAENSEFQAGGSAKLMVANMVFSKSTSKIVELDKSSFAVRTTPPVYTPEITWTSSDPSVATVSASGEVSALKAGKTTITATTAVKPFVSASVDVEVSPFMYFTKGMGTASDPFVLTSAADLAKWSDFVNGKVNDPKLCDLKTAYFRLDADLDMKSTTIAPIPEFNGSLDGNGHAIRNLALSADAIILSANGASFKNLTLSELSLTSTNMYCGGLVSKAEKCSFTNVNIDGTIVSSGKGTHSIGGSVVVAGALAAQLTDCTVDGSTVKIYLGAQGQYIGGIAGMTYGKTVIRGCTLARGSELMSQLNNVGGMVGASFDETLVENCSCHGAVKSKYALVGGMIGQMFSGEVKNCLVSSAAEVSGDVGNGTAADSYSGVGGLVGKVNFANNANSVKALITDSAVYCDVKANDNIGGIVGQTAIAKNGEKAVIANCLFKGSLRTFYKNNYSYGLAGGIIGWAGTATNGQTFIVNCAALVGGITYDVAGSSGCFSGLAGYAQNKATIAGCYSDITAEKIVTSAGAAISTTSVTNYGGLAGRTGGNSTGDNFTSCCYSSAIKAIGGGADTQDLSTCASYSSLKDAAVKAKLESAASAISGYALGVSASAWSADAEGNFVPSSVPADNAPAVGKKVRVSLIGDSISTFSGYLPTGYNTFYPTGDVVSASQTYWYRLIYNNMKNAVLDMNIAWTGTLVTRSTNEAQKSQHWYGHSFNERFIKDGMGSPDVILVHGGTNDVSSRGYSEAKVTLYKDLPTNGAAYPTDAQFAEVFAAADGVKDSRMALEGLPDTTFVEAYVKLISLIHQQYPQARVVMLIGDYLPEGARQSVLKIAAHFKTLYGYQVVDFVASNGYQGSKYITKATGCHPDSNGFKWMADRIYQEQGSYIELQ